MHIPPRFRMADRFADGDIFIVQRQFRRNLLFPELVDRKIAGDHGKPCKKLLLAFVVSQFPDHAEPCLLKHIIRKSVISEHSVQVCVKRPFIPFVENGERIAAAVQIRMDQLLVGNCQFFRFLIHIHET